MQLQYTMNAKADKHRKNQTRANRTGRASLQKINRTTKKSQPQKWWQRCFSWWRARKMWQKIVLITLAFLMLFTAQAYALGYWYQQKHKNEPLTFGVTFVPGYAKYYDLDPHETFLALRDDLGFKRFRLVSYWDNIEPTKGQYDFSELDWEFNKVEEVGGEVTLAIGLRQPRWPECHQPSWAADMQKDEWYKQLTDYMTAVVNRYKDRPALVSYQLENEYYLKVFADCPYTTKERLVDEFNLVKSLDNKTPIIISLSNNYLGIPINKPHADQYGVSVYKRVWDKTITKRYFEYPFPSWYYSWRAALTEIWNGKSSMLHELQAEPWPPTDIKSASIAEQDKSMNADRLAERIDYGVDTGFRDIDLWGGEWWYWRKTKFNDDSLWNTVKAKMAEYNQY